jgi:hypothetical protein
MTKTSSEFVVASTGRADRDRVADAIEGFLRCEIDNFSLDDVVHNTLYDAADLTARGIAREAWFFYGDCKRYKNEGKHKIPEAREAMLRRWILLLRSDGEWPLQEPDIRKRWHCPSRWQGTLKPIGCLLELIILPWLVFQATVWRPRPRSANNPYWPFQSSEEWAELKAKERLS